MLGFQFENIEIGDRPESLSDGPRTKDQVQFYESIFVDRAHDSGDRGRGFDSQPRRSGFLAFFLLLRLTLTCALSLSLF